MTRASVYNLLLELRRKVSLKLELTKVQRKKLSSGGDNIFFGYYDISPFSENGLVLAHRVRKGTFSPDENDVAEVGYFDLKNLDGGFQKVADSRGWSWQLGSRLQWLNKSEKTIIFNDVQDRTLISRIFDVEGGKEISKIEFPVYDISIEQNLAISLNFSRLQRLRPGYGFAPNLDPTINDSSPKDDGIHLVDLSKKTNEVILPLEMVRSIHPDTTMNGATHYFNHLKFSPNGSHFIFFHIWVDLKGKRRTRVLYSDIHASRIELIHNGPIVSHYCWVDDETVLLVIFNKKRPNYCLFSLKDGFKHVFSNKELLMDGHPSVIASEDLFVTDTYPIYNDHQKLFVGSYSKERCTTLGKYFSPPSFRGEFKCDLHPRINDGGDLVCIDYQEKGVRNMQVIGLSKALKSNL